MDSAQGKRLQICVSLWLLCSLWLQSVHAAVNAAAPTTSQTPQSVNSPGALPPITEDTPRLYNLTLSTNSTCTAIEISWKKSDKLKNAVLYRDSQILQVNLAQVDSYEDGLLTDFGVITYAIVSKETSKLRILDYAEFDASICSPSIGGSSPGGGAKKDDSGSAPPAGGGKVKKSGGSSAKGKLGKGSPDNLGKLPTPKADGLNLKPKKGLGGLGSQPATGPVVASVPGSTSGASGSNRSSAGRSATKPPPSGSSASSPSSAPFARIKPAAKPPAPPSVTKKADASKKAPGGNDFPYLGKFWIDFIKRNSSASSPAPKTSPAYSPNATTPTNQTAEMPTARQVGDAVAPIAPEATGNPPESNLLNNPNTPQQHSEPDSGVNFITQAAILMSLLLAGPPLYRLLKGKGPRKK